MAQHGWSVEQNPGKGTLPESLRLKTPDYRLEGVIVDCYTPLSSTSYEGLWQEVERKSGVYGTGVVVMNLRNRNDVAQIRSYFADDESRIAGLHLILGVKDGKVIQIFPDK